MRYAMLVVVFGCATPARVTPTPPSPAPIACTGVAAHVASLFGSGTDHALRVHDVVLARCVEDRWPEPAKRCFLDEASLHGGHRCQDRLAKDPRAALVRGLDGARWPTIDPTRDPCDYVQDLATRIDSCTAVDAPTRQAIRERADRLALEVRPIAPRREGPPVVVRRRGPALQPALVDQVLQDEISPFAAECRSDVDALIKLGAERCGW